MYHITHFLSNSLGPILQQPSVVTCEEAEIHCYLPFVKFGSIQNKFFSAIIQNVHINFNRTKMLGPQDNQYIISTTKDICKLLSTCYEKENLPSLKM